MIRKSSYCSTRLIGSRSGWHLPTAVFTDDGVAVASQILCISTTLNKR